MKHIELTPNEMLNIINAAFFGAQREGFTNETRENIKELMKWYWTIHWDEPDVKSILIDELPL